MVKIRSLVVFSGFLGYSRRLVRYVGCRDGCGIFFLFLEGGVVGVLVVRMFNVVNGFWSSDYGYILNDI